MKRSLRDRWEEMSKEQGVKEGAADGNHREGTNKAAGLGGKGRGTQARAQEKDGLRGRGENQWEEDRRKGLT